MRRSSPRRSDPVPSASPPPSTSRHRRSRSLIAGSHASGAALGPQAGRPSIAATVARPAARGLVDVVAHRRRRPLDLPVASRRAQLPALGRLEGAERPAQQRDDGLERLGAQLAIHGRRRSAQVGRRGRGCAAAGEEALDEAAPVGGRRARRQRPAERDPPRHHGPPSWSSRVARPRTSHGCPAAVGERLEHGGTGPRGVPRGRGRPAPPGRPEPLDHRAAGVIVEGWQAGPAARRRRGRRPRRRRSSVRESVPRTSP